MKAKLTDLNNILFAELERLNNCDVHSEELSAELSRAQVISSVSKNVIDTANTQLSALRLFNEYGYNDYATSEIGEQLLGYSEDSEVKTITTE